MALRHLLDRGHALMQRLPAVRAYWRQHGLRATLARIAMEFFNGKEAQSLAAMNRWRALPESQGRLQPTDRRPLARPRIALIGALDLPQCKKYRVLQKIEELEAHGCRVVVSDHADVPRSFDAMQLARSVLFYRVPDGAVLQAYLDEAARLGLPKVYDIDDPIFCRTIYSENANLQTLTRIERDRLLANSARYLAAMQRCDATIVSTPGLADVAAAYLNGKRVHLWRNAIDAESKAICADITSATAQYDQGRVRIGYMSGSRAHDKDFETIGTALAAVLDKHPHAELLIAGYAQLPSALTPYRHRITGRPFASYRGYFQALSEVDIVAVPLLADAFNACKSAIRFLEAALLGKACVVSAVGDFLNVIEHGRTGYLAGGTEDWMFHLSALIESHERRRRIGMAARAAVLETHTTAAVAAGLDTELLLQLKGGACV